MTRASRAPCSMAGDSVLEVRDLHKTFRIGFFRKPVHAVRGISFSVRRGQIFGFLGPNGAGKTTTIKMALRLIHPPRGSIRLFGSEGASREARARLGYLPENPYVYEYLRPLEFLDLCGRLVGLQERERKARSTKQLEDVGLSDAVDRPIGRFSKGMMQRIGLAQALLHDPEMLILDEPFSGLDPVGRKHVRDVLLDQRRRGKTLIFTSHILSDVEMLCDEVTILNQGLVSATGSLSTLLRPEVRHVEVELANVTAACRAQLERQAMQISDLEGSLVVTIEGDAAVPEVVRSALDHQATLIAVTPKRETLEDLFVRKAVNQDSGP
ncbi:MAG: ABC transporter ATP-binding protein [Proteobacteria bacterium]|nr:ABC transporter ATP-binding protein [Pseudomonadota bacterium]